MDGWTVGLVVVVVLGLAAILAGALIDRARNRRAAAELLSPPDRPIPRFDATQESPRYLSELQARRPPDDVDLSLTDDERRRLETELATPAAVRIPARLASDVFVTDTPTQRAVLTDAVVLLCEDQIASIRELLPVLERCSLTGDPLVIAAPALAPEVLSTAEVNVIQRKLDLAVVLIDERGVAVLGEVTAASATTATDRRAGYFPADCFGLAPRFVSSATGSVVLTTADTEPVE